MFVNPVKSIVLSLIIGSISVMPICAEVIIGDAKLQYVSSPPYEALLITTNMGGGLVFSITEQSTGVYEFKDDYLTTYSLYESNFGAEFLPVDASDPSEATLSEVNSSSIQLFGGNEAKYYAYWEDVLGSTPDVPDENDNYGWLSLTQAGGDLLISDSATALGGGIIVGTYTQIPEPSSLLLLSIGAGGILFYRRSKLRYLNHSSRRRS